MTTKKKKKKNGPVPGADAGVRQRSVSEAPTGRGGAPDVAGTGVRLGRGHRAGPEPVASGGDRRPAAGGEPAEAAHGAQRHTPHPEPGRADQARAPGPVVQPDRADREPRRADGPRVPVAAAQPRPRAGEPGPERAAGDAAGGRQRDRRRRRDGGVREAVGPTAPIGRVRQPVGGGLRRRRRRAKVLSTAVDGMIRAGRA